MGNCSAYWKKNAMGPYSKKANSFSIISCSRLIEITSYVNAGPFKINSQNELGLSLKGGSLENIFWDVANDQNPMMPLM